MFDTLNIEHRNMFQKVLQFYQQYYPYKLYAEMIKVCSFLKCLILSEGFNILFKGDQFRFNCWHSSYIIKGELCNSIYTVK